MYIEFFQKDGFYCKLEYYFKLAYFLYIKIILYLISKWLEGKILSNEAPAPLSIFYMNYWSNYYLRILILFVTFDKYYNDQETKSKVLK